MRSRTLKPDFFTNEQLANCPPLARLLFAGLWCMADRDGRLEDRPRKIKAKILPHDDCDVDELLDKLSSEGLILRYEAEGLFCIEVPNFGKHQRPHPKEPSAGLPGISVKSREKTRKNTARNGQKCTDLEKPDPVREDPEKQIPPAQVAENRADCNGSDLSSFPTQTDAGEGDIKAVKSHEKTRQEMSVCALTSSFLDPSSLTEKTMGEESPIPPLARSDADASSEPVAIVIAELAVLTFPVVGGKEEEWHLFQSKLAEYREAFPGVDVLSECRKALQWIRDNPTRRKTPQGMPRFLGSWLGRAQNQRGGKGNTDLFGGIREFLEEGQG